MSFETRYKQLNEAQRSAVDTIDGPVMVIAGPGTGKTELLSMRAANILKKTDALPENILCLTFTEAGSVAMQKRLTDIVGREAYNISIFTFHAFGTEVMNRYREYFYKGASFRPADDLARHRIVTNILDTLDYNNPLRSQMNGKYTALGDIISAISDLKRAGLTDEEFRRQLDAAAMTIEKASQILGDVFAARVSKTTRDTLADAATEIALINEESIIDTIPTFKDTLLASISHALDAADAHDKVTPPITAWKAKWMTSSPDKRQILKAEKSLPKLRALNHVYSLYLQIMQEAELYDYDDMIMQVVHAMEVNDDLRLDLQEKYQYIMVDEFQDTNMAQMRVLHNLTDNPVFEGKPNILVVGDDDQAIYGFQGAEVGNILNFRETYPGLQLVTLTDNYRSTQGILDAARNIITQGSERLENYVEGLNKTLTAHTTITQKTAEINQFETTHQERSWIADSIRTLIDEGTQPSEIAIIARQHADLVALTSYLVDQNIAISYDRRDNVLEDEVIRQIEQVGIIIQAISVGRHEDANILLPQLLSHPAWGLDPTTVWEISLSAYKNREHWLETMKIMEQTKPLFEWLVAAAQQSQHLPLEIMIDILLGVQALGDYTSPLKDYFFKAPGQDSDATQYIIHLENLSSIRERLREHAATIVTPKLADFLQFMEETREAGAQITSLRHIGEDSSAVRLLTAHGSKGLEFDHVFVVNATDTMWGEKASRRSPSISFPEHLRLRRSNDDYDERLRLFYVAVTRARQGLYVSYADENDATKQTLRAAFLIGSILAEKQVATTTSEANRQLAAEQLWYAPIVNIAPISMQNYLAPIISRYKLSATHINTFIDVAEGGPQHFLLNTLLRFPSGMAAPNSYGVAIHSTLQRAHDHVRATGSQLPEEDLLREFEKRMQDLPFSDDDRRRYTQRGIDALRAYLKVNGHSFTANQHSELDFARQDVLLDGMHLTGKLDVVEFDKEQMTAKVTDYKTGAALASWDKGDEFKKIKAHKYRQQLMFYKLLIEHSRDWHNYRMSEGILQFVEPTNTGDIIALSLSDISDEEMDRFKRLITAVWQRITAMDFPDVSNYTAGYKGIIEFENMLLSD